MGRRSKRGDNRISDAELELSLATMPGGWLALAYDPGEARDEHGRWAAMVAARQAKDKAKRAAEKKAKGYTVGEALGHSVNAHNSRRGTTASRAKHELAARALERVAANYRSGAETHNVGSPYYRGSELRHTSPEEEASRYDRIAAEHHKILKG